MKRWLLTALVLWFIGCATQIEPTPVGSLPGTPLVPSSSTLCDMVTTTEVLAGGRGSVSFPNKPAQFVVESHLRVQGEKFSGPDGFPKKASEGIAAHLAAHCVLLKTKFGVLNCDKVYTFEESDGAPYRRVWTPKEEGGEFGQGSEGINLAPLEQETFIANLPWKAEHPSTARGEKWLLSNPATGKTVVVAMGWESGPTFDEEFLGGTQPAAHYFLDSDNDSRLVIGKLRDQTIAYGPIDCEVSP